MIVFWKSLAPFGRKVVAIGLLAFALAVIGGVTSCQMARNAKIEARLSKGQTGAALASGADAVDTVGDVSARAAASDALTKENADAIRSAPGAAVPVDPALHGAGLAGLCRRAAYRGRPECLQQPAP
jgi:hypothetical protein